MEWVKLGQIFEPAGNYSWMVSHAAVPFAEEVAEDIFRVYFCTRDAKNRGHVAYFEIDIKKPKEILYLHPHPLIEPGPLGSFEDSGVISSWLVNFNRKKYLYYCGISLGVTVPFYFFASLAISEDEGQTFHKVSPAPLLGRNNVDPYLTGQVCVLNEGNIWRMWYVSGVRWEIDGEQPKHYYHIKYAESTDGIEWNRTGLVCIDFKEPEYAFGRPCVLYEGGIYKMWYSYRGQSYRIGYAESENGLQWERKDEKAGIDVSKSGWDSDMIEYAHVFNHKGTKYMLYNGNGYGKTGIGLAVLVE